MLRSFFIVLNKILLEVIQFLAILSQIYEEFILLNMNCITHSCLWSVNAVLSVSARLYDKPMNKCWLYKRIHISVELVYMYDDVIMRYVYNPARIAKFRS